MTFTVIRSADPNDEFAPFRILLDGALFLDGIEFEAEAISICECLQLATPLIPHRRKIVVMNQRRFTPKRMDLTETRKFLSQLKPRGGAS